MYLLLIYDQQVEYFVYAYHFKNRSFTKAKPLFLKFVNSNLKQQANLWLLKSSEALICEQKKQKQMRALTL